MSKTILITGTSSGFGGLTAIDLAKRGHRVIAAMRNTSSSNKAVAATLNGISNIEVVEMDVTSTESVNTAVQGILKKYGRIDVLVNNAGIAGIGLLEATSIEQMKRVFEVNLWGVLRTYQAVLPSMRKDCSGLIINISTGLGLVSAPYLGPYVGSKYALEGITEAIRYEIKEFGIETVNVLPGAFPTELGNKGGQGQDKPEIIGTYGAPAIDKLQQFGGILFQKIADYKMNPQEVADAIRHLVEMEPGTRPFHTSVNRITDDLEQDYADRKVEFQGEWMKRMGWGAWL